MTSPLSTRDFEKVLKGYVEEASVRWQAKGVEGERDAIATFILSILLDFSQNAPSLVRDMTIREVFQRTCDVAEMKLTTVMANAFKEKQEDQS